MMKITGLSHLFKWENLHNWWLTKYFFAPLYFAFFWFNHDQICSRYCIKFIFCSHYSGNRHILYRLDTASTFII